MQINIVIKECKNINKVHILCENHINTCQVLGHVYNYIISSFKIKKLAIAKWKANKNEIFILVNEIHIEKKKNSQNKIHVIWSFFYIFKSIGSVITLEVMNFCVLCLHVTAAATSPVPPVTIRYTVRITTRSITNRQTLWKAGVTLTMTRCSSNWVSITHVY